MAEEHLKKCSTSFVIREMYIKPSLRFHFISVRIAKFSDTSDSSCWQRCEARRTFFLMGMKTNGSENLDNHYGNQYYSSFRKLGVDLSTDPAITFLSIYTEDTLSYHKDT